MNCIIVCIIMGGVSIETSFWTSYYITGDEPGKKKSCEIVLKKSFVVPVNIRVINPKMLTVYFAK